MFRAAAARPSNLRAGLYQLPGSRLSWKRMMCFARGLGLNLPAADLEDILQAFRPDSPLRGARIFMTGGTGFWGVWLLESLLHANRRLGLDIEAVVLTRDEGPFLRLHPDLGRSPSLRFIHGDVRSFAFPKGDFTHAIHLATPTGTVAAEEITAVIADGTRRVLEFARERGIGRLLLASSGAVYGRQPTELCHIPESHPGRPDPRDPHAAYGLAKRIAEELCQLAGRPAALIARGFAFVGPGLPLQAHFAIGNFIRDAVARRPVIVRGDGTPVRSYLYASDLAAWLWTILAAGAPGRPYNVGSEEAVSLLELAERVAALRGVTVQVERRAGEPSTRYVPSTRRAAEELGLSQKVSLQEAITRTCLWAEHQAMEAA